MNTMWMISQFQLLVPKLVKTSLEIYGMVLFSTMLFHSPSLCWADPTDGESD